MEEVKKSKKDIYAICLKEEKESFIFPSDLYCMKDFTTYRKKEGLLIRKNVYFQE